MPGCVWEAGKAKQSLLSRGRCHVSPDVLVTCVVSADSVTGLETERTPRTEQRRGATNDPPPSVSSGHRASTDCYLDTEHSIGHCVREIINNQSFENIKSDACGRRG